MHSWTVCPHWNDWGPWEDFADVLGLLVTSYPEVNAKLGNWVSYHCTAGNSSQSSKERAVRRGWRMWCSWRQTITLWELRQTHQSLLAHWKWVKVWSKRRCGVMGVLEAAWGKCSNDLWVSQVSWAAVTLWWDLGDPPQNNDSNKYHQLTGARSQSTSSIYQMLSSLLLNYTKQVKSAETGSCVGDLGFFPWPQPLVLCLRRRLLLEGDEDVSPPFLHPWKTGKHPKNMQGWISVFSWTCSEFPWKHLAFYLEGYASDPQGVYLQAPSQVSTGEAFWI